MFTSIKTLCVSCLLTASLCAADLKIKGIVLTSDADSLHQFGTAEGVVVKNLLFGSSLKDKLGAQYLDQPLTDTTPHEIRNSILEFYKSQNSSMVVVHIPEQEISSGTITFVVLEAKAGTVTFAGNRWFPNKIFEKGVSIQPGESIDDPKILNAVAWLNRNPFHNTEVIVSPGKKNGVSNLDFVTQDRFPLRPFIGVDNTGTEFTQEIRLFAGVNWGNAFNVDDLLTLQFTAAPNLHPYKSYFASYTSFLPWKHAFTLFGAYAKIHPKIDDFSSEGTDIQASARYDIPFKPLFTKFLHDLIFGFDFKTYNNDLFFTEFSLGVPIISRKIDLTQFYLAYKLNDTVRGNDVTLTAEIFGSPAQWLPHQTPEAYASLRPNAKPRYAYGRLSLGDIYTFSSGCRISFLFRGQGSSGPLLPSEQFALGGYNTIRGYDELDFPADNAICVNLEFRSPYWQIFRSLKDRFFLLAFVDYGWGRNDQVTLDLPNKQTLIGVGPGLRYTMLSYLNIRVDYGFQLNHIFDDHRFGKWHFSVAASY